MQGMQTVWERLGESEAGGGRGAKDRKWGEFGCESLVPPAAGARIAPPRVDRQPPAAVCVGVCVCVCVCVPRCVAVR